MVVRVDVRVLSPWSIKTTKVCPVFNKAYVPISYMAWMLDKAQAELSKKWRTSAVHKIAEGGTFRNFVKVSDLPNLLAHEGWDARKIAEGMKIFQEVLIADEASSSSSSKTPPKKKREWNSPPGTPDLLVVRGKSEDDGGEAYLKRGKTKRKAVVVAKKTPAPEWAQDLISLVEDTVKEKAVERYMMSEAYAEACREAVAARVALLEPEMKRLLRPDIVKELREELKIPVRQELELEQKEAMMEPFKLRLKNVQSNEALLDSVFGARQNQSK